MAVFLFRIDFYDSPCFCFFLAFLFRTPAVVVFPQGRGKKTVKGGCAFVTY